MDTDIYRAPDSGLEPSTQIETELASRWARLGAYLLDTLFLSLPFIIIAILNQFYPTNLFVVLGDTSQIFIDIGTALATGGVFLLMHGYLLYTSGQTLGKKLLSIRIVNSRTNEIPDFWSLIALRYLIFALAGSFIPFFGTLVVLIDPLLIFGKDKRCLHDLAADTKVINA